MSKYLDTNGLLYVWSKIKALLSGKVDKAEGKGLSTNDYTAVDKAKLDALENYTLPAATAETLGGVKVGAGLAVTDGVLSATGGGTADAVAWENVTGKPDVALKSDIAGIYRYKGSVAAFSNLPSQDNSVGDVWNVEATGMNYAWDGESWDALGQMFEIQSISNAEIDAALTA